MENNAPMARCKVSVKDISIAASGIKALNTNVKGSKHKERLPKVGSQSFLKFGNKAAVGSALAKQPESSCEQSSFDSCAERTLVINAKIMWALDVVMSKNSFNSSSNKE